MIPIDPTDEDLRRRFGNYRFIRISLSVLGILAMILGRFMDDIVGLTLGMICLLMGLFFLKVE